MTAIGMWLQRIGLDRYSALFEQAEIDISDVALLSDGDLQELGLPLGPRKRILAERDNAHVSSGGEPASELEQPTAPERRQLTVMFSDLVDSTAMSAQLDPEQLNEILTAYRHALAEEITANGGTVAKYMGDGVLAYFGWPIAQEDAAENAIRAGFGAIRKVQTLPGRDRASLHCRVGLATGLAVVGGVIGSGTAREDQVAGEVLNLAARLQSLAEPDGLLTDERTHRLAGERFEWRALGKHAVKGFGAPVSVWTPLTEHSHASRFGVRTVLSNLVGRRAEVALLTQRWKEAQDGKGGAVLIVGEPGLGKSRLCESLGDADGAATARLQCSSLHQNNALYPLVECLTGSAQINDPDSPQERFDKLRALLASQGAAVDRVLPLFADLLSIPITAPYTLPPMLPTQKRAATIGALVEWLSDLSDARPLLLTVEDAHWIDATTLEVVTRMIGLVPCARMLILATARPEFASPWSGRPRVDVIGLDRLADAECAMLVRSLSGARDLAPETIDQIVAKADGNPLFLEELSLTVLGGSSSGEALLVPDTLQGTLMARIDSLGEAKGLAQTAAVLGRRFARPLLSEVTGLAPHELDTGLSSLIAGDVIHPLGRLSEGRFEFKHALVRDAAYASLLIAKRTQLHKACADMLERDFPEVAQTEPELLAYHFAEAGQAERSSIYHELTGDRAAARFSFLEALASYAEALHQTELAPSGEARDRRIVALLLKRGPAQCIISGPQSADVQATYDRAQPIARELGDFDALFKATWGLWFNANVGRRFARSAALADELVELSASGDDGHVLEGLHCRWSSGLFRGDYFASAADAERGQALYHRERHHRLGVGFGGHDPGVCAHGVRCVALVAAGYPDEAVEHAKLAVTLADELDHPSSTAHAPQNSTSALCLVGDYAEALVQAERLHVLATRFNFPPLRLLANHLIGWAEVQGGDRERGLARMAADYEPMIATSPMPVQYAALYADEVAKGGKAADALQIIDTLFERLGRPEAGHYLSELLRVRGDCLALLGREPEAVSAWTAAERLCEAQGAAWLKLRVLSSRFAHGDRPAQAREDLTRSLSQLHTTRLWPDLITATAYIESTS